LIAENDKFLQSLVSVDIDDVGDAVVADDVGGVDFFGIGVSVLVFLLVVGTVGVAKNASSIGSDTTLATGGGLSGG
jgi:hypothetical protein